MFFECQLFGPVQLSRQRSTTSDLENVCPIFFVMYIYLDVDYLSSMTGCLTCFAVVVCVFFVCFFFSEVSSCWSLLACVKEKENSISNFHIGRIYRSFIDQLLFEEKKKFLKGTWIGSYIQSCTLLHWCGCDTSLARVPREIAITFN